MMAYTTYTAAVHFGNVRRPKIRRPVDTRLVEFSARSSGSTENRESRVHRLVTQPIAAR